MSTPDGSDILTDGSSPMCPTTGTASCPASPSLLSHWPPHTPTTLPTVLLGYCIMNSSIFVLYGEQSRLQFPEPSFVITIEQRDPFVCREVNVVFSSDSRNINPLVFSLIPLSLAMFYSDLFLDQSHLAIHSHFPKIVSEHFHMSKENARVGFRNVFQLLKKRCCIECLRRYNANPKDFMDSTVLRMRQWFYGPN